MKLYYSDTLPPQKACAVARHVDAPVNFFYVNLGSCDAGSSCSQCNIR